MRTRRSRWWLGVARPGGLVLVLGGALARDVPMLGWRSLPGGLLAGGLLAWYVLRKE